jgi:MYXO-CTERM domain-containing protein
MIGAFASIRAAGVHEAAVSELRAPVDQAVGALTMSSASYDPFAFVGFDFVTGQLVTKSIAASATQDAFGTISHEARSSSNDADYKTGFTSMSYSSVAFDGGRYVGGGNCANLDETVTPAPEPATWAAGAFALIAVLAIRPRRRIRA